MRSIALLLLFLPLSVMAQGLTVRSSGGYSTNQTLITPTVEGYLRASEGATKTNATFVGSVNGILADAIFNSVTIPGTTNWNVAGNTRTFNLFTTNLMWLRTNSTTPPAALPGGGWFWNSNQVLYWVTSTKTNVVSDGR